MTMRFLPLVTRFLRSVVAVSASAAARGYIAAIDHGSARIRAVENGDARSVVHALEEDGHRHRRHLLVADLAGGVCIDQPIDALGRQHLAGTLGADQFDGVE